ncbi:N-6 DNA methylase [Nocardia wallacei]|uniref:N-6 DNA methylase n=1 Tax=Nocardia wallacei TaxID=480035 RepID=UPI00245515F1|nr:N-6 DNA methylase [Nocardia wallacei]
MRSADLAQTVFKAVDFLRSTLTSAECTRVVSVVLVLKWASNHPEKLTVPKQAQWDQLVAAASTSPRDALEAAAAALVSSNPGIFEDAFQHLDPDRRLTDAQTRQLITTLDEIPVAGEDPARADQVAAQVYDRFLAAFGDKRNEFATPRSVCQLMVQLADPQPGHSVYDPCVGAGGLLTAADAYVADCTDQTDALFLFGQDINQQTCAVARLNLLLHNITNATVLVGDALSDPKYLYGAGMLKNFDRVVSNPPFSLKHYGESVDIPQQTRYGVSRGADLMFVQHILASLAPNGVGVVTVPHGVLFRGGIEAEIRKGMLDDGRVAAIIALGRNIFHNTSIPASLMVLRGEHAADTSRRDVLFINAEREVDSARSKNYLAPRHIERIATAFHQRRDDNHFSRLVPIEEIASNGFNLNVSAYIDPPSTAHPSPDIGALLAGGVPASEIEAARDRFAAFGIELTSLFVPHNSGYLSFPPHGYEATAAAIPAKTAPTETAFITAVERWSQEFRKNETILTGEPLAIARNEVATTFRSALSTPAVLNGDQLTGLFTDWWKTNQEDLNQLRRPDNSTNSPKAQKYDAIYDRIGADLVARAKTLVAQERNHLVNTYLAWGYQYGTSLKKLETQRAETSARLTTHLRKLGYPWDLHE